jgi:3-hydroxyisobutyrate dehydrogenase
MNGRVGFIGLGVMGQPMATNLLKAGTPLIVWNRTPDRCEPLRPLGATVAATVSEVCEQADTIILTLFDRAAIDEVLQRGTSRFTSMVEGRTVMNMSSIAPADSRALARDIHSCGGTYVEAPISGSRIPAEQGQLVVMLAGDSGVAHSMRPLLAPMSRAQVFCGAVGDALLMKLAVNLFRLVMTNGLVEAVHFVDRNHLDFSAFEEVVNASPMASASCRTTLAKLRARDYSPHAATTDALNSTQLIVDAAQHVRAACDLIQVCRSQYQDAVDLGYGAADLISALQAIEVRSEAMSKGPNTPTALA